MRNRKPIGSWRQAGFSLVELMISLVIGMVVVGAVFAAYLSSGTSSKASQALAQITEDATISLNVMRSSVSMVGYGSAKTADAKTGKFVKLYPGVGTQPGIFGCESGFTADSNKWNGPIEKLACDAGGDGASIALAYEADSYNSVLSSGGKPIDCLGDELNNAPGYYLAYNRFYVSKGALYCLGGAKDTAAQALVDNVESLDIRYGVASAAFPNQAVRYLKADAMNAADFDRTVSVRICVVVRSTDQVLDQNMKYLDCGGNEVDAADRRLYRSFTTTVVLQNRLGVA
jgi:type IV pilus assembly protein PilW